ncbi:PREDICTED: MLP-like protein 328 [Camelina sativa]|uniref:MLP-like protein 328 n=1 Tax=Camelina sativa TaxID=90675 RepID=A0ABM0U634_CAMSA|nr:PREDICTED: MLP-like protein 328 [Camelina sativa]
MTLAIPSPIPCKFAMDVVIAKLSQICNRFARNVNLSRKFLANLRWTSEDPPPRKFARNLLGFLSHPTCHCSVVHEGEHDSHGSIRSWNYTYDGKPATFKERREIDDANKTLTTRGLEGHLMEDLKVFDVVYQFIPKPEDSCVCKITMIWEKRNDDFAEPSGLMKFVKNMVVDIEGHVTKA